VYADERRERRKKRKKHAGEFSRGRKIRRWGDVKTKLRIERSERERWRKGDGEKQTVIQTADGDSRLSEAK